MQAVDFYRKNARTHNATDARAALTKPAALVNMRSFNIFNGLWRVPVKEKIPALYFI